MPTPSTFSVTGNKVLKDTLRFSVGEMLALVDQINRDRSLLNTWQMLDVRGFAASPYIANAYRGNGPFQFATDRVNGESTRNRLYPDRATLVSPAGQPAGHGRQQPGLPVADEEDSSRCAARPSTRADLRHLRRAS